MDTDTNETIYTLDSFVTVKPGEPFRLLPFGRIVKGGRVREVTRDLAGRFQLPHFRPPVKRGSHNETTPAVGHIVGLEVRDDGLYAIPEWTAEGEAALARGDYRYHSPEILWEGGLEDPATGRTLAGPMIIGDALLHTPHLGEATALYSVEPHGGDPTMADNDMVTVPVSFWDKLLAALLPKNEPEPEPAVADPEVHTAAVDVEQFNALQAERDEYAAKLQAIEAEQQMTARVAQFGAELAETPLAEDVELHKLLAGLTDETAAALVARVKALSEQARVGNLTADVGHSGDGVTGDPVTALDAAIQAKMNDGNLDYNAALLQVRAEQPALFVAAGYGR